MGDIFSTRIAGNILNDDIIGSMEFACKLAGSKLIVVLGHSNCGAITGACVGTELGHLTHLLSKVDASVQQVKKNDATITHGWDHIIIVLDEKIIFLKKQLIRFLYKMLCTHLIMY